MDESKLPASESAQPISVSAQIAIDDFAKVQIKMGKVLSAERVEGSDKLLKLSIDVGEPAPRTICSGVAQYYQPEEVIGKMVPVIVNLAPRKMRGVESQGMVLFAINETPVAVEGAESKPGHVPVMLNPDKGVPPGSPVA